MRRVRARGTGLAIEATIAGLLDGEYALRLHENADCPAAASSAGRVARDARELGDPTAGAGGTARMTREDSELRLIGEHGVVGKAVIVQGRADAPTTESSDGYGEPIACGAVQW